MSRNLIFCLAIPQPDTDGVSFFTTHTTTMNTPDQTPRITVFLVVLGVVIFGSYFLTLAFFGSENFAFLAATGLTGCFVLITFDYFLIDPPGDEVWMANPEIFGKTDDGGFRIYTQFPGGLQFKYPWERIEFKVNLTRELIVTVPDDEFEAEDQVGIVTYTYSVKPDPAGLQEFIKVKESEREKIYESVFNGEVHARSSDLFKRKTLEWHMRNTRKFVRKVNRKLEDNLKAARYGVLLNSFTIAKMDLTEGVKNARQRKSELGFMLDAAEEILRREGLVQGEIPPKDWEEKFDKALQYVREGAGEITREIKEYGFSEPVLEAFSKGLAAFLKKNSD